MICCIKEISTVEVAVEYRNATINTSRIDNDFDRALLNVGAVEIHREIKRIEADVRVRVSKVGIGKGDIAMVLVDAIFARRHI